MQDHSAFTADCLFGRPFETRPRYYICHLADATPFLSLATIRRPKATTLIRPNAARRHRHDTNPR